MTRRPRLAKGVALLLVGGAALVACGGGEGADDRLPEVSVVEIGTGDVLDLADVEGPAVINLWATTCAPCVREIPEFEQVHQERGDGVRFIGINIGEDEERAAGFVADVGATYEQYLDELGYVVSELQTTGMPVTLVIDDEGRITTRHLGAMDVGDLEAAIDGALGI